MADVLIYSPFPRQASQGNSVTADRLEKLLLDAGYAVSMETEHYDGADAGCLVALNARRSAEVVEGFSQAHPGQRIIVILTGTDINHPDMGDEGSPTRRAMDQAHALVTLHDADLNVLPSSLQEKTTCIFPSVQLPEGSRHQPEMGKSFEVIMAGNLRPVKNPGLAVDAARLLPGDSVIHMSSFGDSDGKLAEEIRLASDELVSFDWLGKVDHPTLIGKMERAHMLLNTSTQEGGANAICEAITMGLPVVASQIPGNIGMLGESYLGFFPSGDAEALAEVLQRCSTDKAFYSKLKSQLAGRAPLFAYAAESKAWNDLVTAQLSR